MKTWSIATALGLNVLAALGSGVASASPVGATDLGATTAPDPAASAAAVRVAPDELAPQATPLATGASKTLDLLLELQPRGADLSPKDGAAHASKPADVGHLGVRVPGAAETALKEGGVFGASLASGPSNSGVGERGSVSWSRGDNSAGSAGYAPVPGGGSAASDGGESIHLIPRWLIQFIRENRREVVASALGVLAVLWGASALISRRR